MTLTKLNDHHYRVDGTLFDILKRGALYQVVYINGSMSQFSSISRLRCLDWIENQSVNHNENNNIPAGDIHV